MRTKSLVLMMTYREATEYVLHHNNEHRIPNAEEAEQLTAEHPSFWVDENLGDRRLVYNKKDQCFVRQHPLMKHHVVLIYNTPKKYRGVKHLLSLVVLYFGYLKF